MEYNAEIISIGNELLIGKTINTNAAWLARKLTVLGFNVKRITTIGDSIDEIVSVLREAIRRKPKIIITTGGLGPTFDDKTSEALAKALNRPWIVNEEALELVRRKYVSIGLELTPCRVKMAKMPKDAEPLPNPVGTAPGIMVYEKETIIFSLPGVPREMKAIFEEHVEPFLRKIGPNMYFCEKSIKIKGIPESSLAPLISRVMKMVSRVYIKSHPKGSEGEQPVIELHITSSDTAREKAEYHIKETLEILLKLIRENFQKFQVE